MPNTGMVLRASLLTLALSSSGIAQQRDTAFSWSRKLPDGARFAIRNLNGGIEVRAGSTDQVVVRAIIRTDSPNAARDLSFDVREHAPDDIEICTADRGVNACVPEDTPGDRHITVRYLVDLPTGLRLRAVTGAGDVIVMQTVSEVDISTGGGDVVVRESTGRASATSGNGEVTIALANGPVRATTGNGRVNVNTWLGPVNASSGNGNVDVRMISVAPAQPPESMSLSSGNGDVRLVLPADFSGDIDATTGHGGIRSDFNVRSQGSGNDSRLRGSIGNGAGLLIKLHTGNGRLEIRKD